MAQRCRRACSGRRFDAVPIGLWQADALVEEDLGEVERVSESRPVVKLKPTYHQLVDALRQLRDATNRECWGCYLRGRCSKDDDGTCDLLLEAMKNADDLLDRVENGVGKPCTP